MNCPNCGANNPDKAKFCRSCGQSLSQLEMREIEPIPAPIQPEPIQPEPTRSEPEPRKSEPIPASVTVEGAHQDPVCPHCGGTDCQPVSRTTGSVKGGGYSIGNGCCGLCLLGPLGLLCGLFGSGSKMDLKNEVVWVCRSCGKEHLSQKDGLEKAIALATSFGTGAAIVALVLSFGVNFYGWSWLLAAAWAFSPLIVYGMVETQISEELGYPMKEILPPSTSIPMILVGAEIGVILLLWLGGPMLFDLLESIGNQ